MQLEPDGWLLQVIEGHHHKYSRHIGREKTLCKVNNCKHQYAGSMRFRYVQTTKMMAANSLHVLCMQHERTNIHCGDDQQPSRWCGCIDTEGVQQHSDDRRCVVTDSH